MKKIFLMTFILAAFLSAFTCKKNVQNTDSSKDSKEEAVVENATQFVKVGGLWAFAKDEDVGKKSGDVKDKIYLEFGSKVTVLKTKKFNDLIYNRFQTPDKNEYWALKDNFTAKFIVINKTDVNCYKQPDQAYIMTIKLQPGDYGVFVKQIDDFINVDFAAYRKYKDTDEKKGWVGNVWIKDQDYTSDLYAAKQGYYLYLAYYYAESKNDIKSAIEMCQKAFDSTGNASTDISYVVSEYMEQLKAKQ